MQEQEMNGTVVMLPRRTRRGKKRVVFKLPPTAPSVKELWLKASEENRQKAHTTCALVLEYWLGRTTKQDLAQRLAVPPLRVWQLSQLALSGMLAGLLKQPRGRGAHTMPATSPEDDPKRLRKRIAELEQKLKLTEDLVMLLRELPAHRPAKAEGNSKQNRGATSRETRLTPTRGKKTDRAPSPRAQAERRREALEKQQPPDAG